MKTGSATLHPELYKAYSNNLRKGIAGVMNSDKFGDKYFDLQQQLQANVSRFAAYKAYRATQLIQRQLADENGVIRSDETYRKHAKTVLDAFNRYQVAEYNTAIARARTAKQWIDFNADPVSNELYPNIKWLPSRSADPREEHKVFWNKVWAKIDPFWNENQPGNLWRCKCDWEETDEPVTGGTYNHKSQAGLEGNPAQTGEIFTDRASYFKVSQNGKEDVSSFFEPIENNHKEYIQYAKNTNYNNVKFSWDNGGLMATHKEHSFDPNRGRHEKDVQKIGFANGNTVIFESEKSSTIGMKHNDGLWNNEPFEIGTSLGTGKNNIKSILNHAKGKRANVAIIYFPEKGIYSHERLRDGVKKYNGQTQYRFKKILYIVDGVIHKYK